MCRIVLLVLGLLDSTDLVDLRMDGWMGMDGLGGRK